MHARSLLAPGLLAALLIPALAAGRVVRAPCRDGIPPRILCASGKCSRPVQCDTDGQCNGVCTYVLHVCPPPEAFRPAGCMDETETVAVGAKQVLTLQATRFIFHCRAHPRGVPCPTTTTTTPSTSSTTTTTVPSQPPSCQSNADCQLNANPCIFPLCFDPPGVCACSCLQAGSFTCSPDQADHCSSNADCPPVGGDPCRHCDSGLCMTNPLCV